MQGLGEWADDSDGCMDVSVLPDRKQAQAVTSQLQVFSFTIQSKPMLERASIKVTGDRVAFQVSLQPVTPQTCSCLHQLGHPINQSINQSK